MFELEALVMKLHCFAAWMIFILLLFGLATAAHSQQKDSFFAPFQKLPTRLFGSTSGDGCADGCGQGEISTKNYLHPTACRPRPSLAQKPCGCEATGKTSSKNSVTQKSVTQKSVTQKPVVQKSITQKCYPAKTVVQRSTPQQSGCGCCDTSCMSCKPQRVAFSVSKLDGAIKGLFCSGAEGCKLIPDACGSSQKSCSPSCGKAHSADGYWTDGYKTDGYHTPEELRGPNPYQDPDVPQTEGNPFEDDAVTPPPPVPSEASLPHSPKPLLGPVATGDTYSPYRVQSPARFDPAKATPLRKEPQLAKSILDRGDSAATRRSYAISSRCRLTSAHSGVR
jgi:hypothetical protein